MARPKAAHPFRGLRQRRAHHRDHHLGAHLHARARAVRAAAHHQGVQHQAARSRVPRERSARAHLRRRPERIHHAPAHGNARAFERARDVLHHGTQSERPPRNHRSTPKQRPRDRIPQLCASQRVANPPTARYARHDQGKSRARISRYRIEPLSAALRKNDFEHPYLGAIKRPTNRMVDDQFAGHPRRSKIAR